MQVEACPAWRWGVAAVSQSSGLTTTLFVIDRRSEGHFTTLIALAILGWLQSSLLSETLDFTQGRRAPASC